MPGWADPKTFTDTGFVLLVFFHNGALIPGTGITIMSYPISGNTLSAEPSDSPCPQSAVLSTLKPGDVVAIADDIGAAQVSDSL